jgi:hypothetical protein
MCPVCYYGNMPYPAEDYNICPCCGTEFENHDEDQTHAELRQSWIAAGARWFFRQAPATWNPWQQIASAGVMLPYVTTVTYLGSPVASRGIQKLSYEIPYGSGVHTLYRGEVLGSSSMNLLQTNFDLNQRESVATLVGEFTQEPLGMAA